MSQSPEHVTVLKWLPDGRVSEFLKTPISTQEAGELLDAALRAEKAKISARQREQAVALQRERMKAAALQQAEREKAERAKAQEAELATLEAEAKRVIAQHGESMGESTGRQIMEGFAKKANEAATPEMKARGYKVSVTRLEPTMRNALEQVRKQTPVLIAVSQTRIFPALSATFDDAFERGFWRGIDAVCAEESGKACSK